MARHPFGGGTADWTFTAGTGDAATLASAAVTFWNGPVGGTRYTDLSTDPDGITIVDHIFSSDGTDGLTVGTIPPFYGPANVTTLWASANAGPRARMVALDVGDNLASHQVASNPHAVSVATLTDTAVSGPTDGQLLRWSAGMSKWVPGVAPGSPRFLSVKDYGAVGDDATDDYTAITAALAAAGEGDTVFFPKGTYRISQPIKPARNVTLMGVHSSRWSYKSGMPSCVKTHSTWTSTSDGLISLRDKEISGASVELEGVRLVSLGIDGNGFGSVGAGARGIYAHGHVQDVELIDVDVKNCKGNGIETADYTRTDTSVQICSGWKMQRVSAVWGNHGFVFNKLTDSNLYDCLAVAVSGDGFQFNNPSDDHLTSCRSVFNAAGYGFKVTGANGSIQLANCSTDRNGKDGFYLNCTDGRQSILLTGCYARRDGAIGPAGSSGFAGFRVVGTASGSPHPPVMMVGCATHVSKDDSGADPACPDYGLRVDTASRGVALAGASLAGVVAGLNDTVKAVAIGPGCQFNTTAAVGLVQTWDPGDRVRMMGAAGTGRQVEYWTAGSGQRWGAGVTADTESGSNAGANYAIARYSDAGAFLDNLLTMLRSSGRVGIGQSVPSAKLHVESSVSEVLLNLINTNASLGAGGLIKLLTAITSPVNALQMGYQSDTVVRFNIKTDGAIEWGPGGSTARDTTLSRSGAGALATGGALDVAGTLKSSGAGYASSIRTDSGTVTATAFTATRTGAGGEAGMSFVAPGSGIVVIHWHCGLSNATAGAFTLMSFEVRTGSTVGSGTVVQAAADTVTIQGNATTEASSGTWYPVTGLTPGSTYNVRPMYRVGSGTGTFNRPRIAASPALG
jgi:hypothetical protein